MTKPVSPQVLPPVPPRDYHQMVLQVLTLQHAQDHHSSATFAIVSLLRATLGQDCTPCIVGGLTIGFATVQIGESCVNGGAVGYRCSGNRVTRSPVRQDDTEFV